jgi:hypothetical protein
MLGGDAQSLIASLGDTIKETAQRPNQPHSSGNGRNPVARDGRLPGSLSGARRGEECMADRKWLGWFVGIVAIVSILLARGQDGDVGAAERQTLMVEVAVCPVSGAAGHPAECRDRLARAFNITVVDAASTPVADDVAPDAKGQAEIDVTARTPTSLTVAVNTAVNVGTRSVSCVADETPLDASLVGGAAAIPVFQVDVETTADITCIVSLFGFPNDDERLDIILTDAEATPVATPPLPSSSPVACIEAAELAVCGSGEARGEPAR